MTDLLSPAPAGRATGVPTRAQLRRHLVEHRIAGEVATTRQNNLQNFRHLSERNDHYLFGLELDGRWEFADVLDLMVRRVGVHPDPSYDEGMDTIDPELTLERLEAMRERIALAARERQRVLLATGHPAGVLAIHLEVAAALAAAGCEVLTPAPGWCYESDGRHREIRHLGRVAMVSDRGQLNHTHSPEPMRAMLATLAADGEPHPDLVVADHGWAGAAGQAGIDAVGFADCNDPALFVGEEEGKVKVSVPLDDNVLPHLYAPLTAYLLDGVTGTRSAPDA